MPTPIPSFHIFSPAFKKEAYTIYTQLRQEDPIHLISMPSGKEAWLVTTYHDAIEILKDSRFTKEAQKFLSPNDLKNYLPSTLSTHMLNSDPPDHTRLRSLIQKVFSPRMVENQRIQVQQIADELLERISSKKEIDLICEYAYPLPIMVISEMLGIPLEDRNQFREWSTVIVAASNNPEETKSIIGEIQKFIHYLESLVEKRKKHPGQDVISHLIQAEEEGNKLSKEELYSMIFLLIVAGHETTVNLIGNGVYTLLNHPQQLHNLKQNPDKLHACIEEILRFSSPVEMSTNRWAKEDMTYKDTLIRKKDHVLVSIASCNRDPLAFKQADVFDIDRPDNRHLAFGIGTHFCLGASLARLEGAIAIHTLFHRFPSLKLAVPKEELHYQPGFLMRGFSNLPVTLG